MSKDISTRMKNYESVTQNYLIRRMPVIIRVDGKAFHTLTRGLKKPWDDRMYLSMGNTALALCKIIQNCKLAYFQSDEISFLMVDYSTLTTDSWFDNNVQKIVSISAGYTSSIFSKEFNWCGVMTESPIVFDARAFNLTKEEVNNYFVWRQQDAVRNSIQGLGQANFSHKQLHRLSCNQIQDKLLVEKDINWNDTPIYLKRGTCVIKTDSGWVVDREIPIFSKDKKYIENLVFVGD